jgi:hypothetical protein
LSIRYRPMRLNDIPECVRIIASHPVLSQRYGKGIEELEVVWRRFLANEWFITTSVFEEDEAWKLRVHGVAMSGFVSGKFLREAKTAPFFWLGPEIAKRVIRGKSPLLTEKQVSEANSREGLNLVILLTGVNPADMRRPEAWDVGVTAFVELHRGFRLNEIVTQSESVEHLAGIVNAGLEDFLSENTAGSYRDLPGQDQQRVLMDPHLFGLTRDTAARQLGSWVGILFRYESPRLGFSRSEQHLLRAALRGGTDEELSDALCISESAVKKAWRAIYLRVTDRMPELIPNQSADDGSMPDRGKEKKRRLLAYLREHLEELRPYSRKLLQGHSVAPGSVQNRNSPARPHPRFGKQKYPK